MPHLIQLGASCSTLFTQVFFTIDCEFTPSHMSKSQNKILFNVSHNQLMYSIYFGSFLTDEKLFSNVKEISTTFDRHFFPIPQFPNNQHRELILIPNDWPISQAS